MVLSSTDIMNLVFDPTSNSIRNILVDSTGTIIKLTRTRENLAGSSGTGSNGDPTRTYTLTTSNAVDIVEVYLNGVLLIEITNYTIDNSNKQITFVATSVLDAHTVTIFYNQ